MFRYIILESVNWSALFVNLKSSVILFLYEEQFVLPYSVPHSPLLLFYMWLIYSWLLQYFPVVPILPPFLFQLTLNLPLLHPSLAEKCVHSDCSGNTNNVWKLKLPKLSIPSPRDLISKSASMSDKGKISAEHWRPSSFQMPIRGMAMNSSNFSCRAWIVELFG